VSRCVAASASPVTIVTYHFVRPVPSKAAGQFFTLDPAAFLEQLRYLLRHYAPVRLTDIVEAAKGSTKLPPRPVVLTFDDGYRDHYVNVFPLLEARRIPAVFFPVRSALVDRQMLDANKVQFLLAALPDCDAIVKAIDGAVEALPEPSATVAEYRARWWSASRFDGPGVAYVKRMLQHALPEVVRRPLLDALFRRHVTSDEAAFAAALYLTVDEAREMRDGGMAFGGHGDRHIPLTALTEEEQAEEIDGALRTLDAIGVPRASFAYSYVKGEHDATSIGLLRARGCSVALTTREDVARIGVDDLLALPRLDTTGLPIDGNASPNAWTRKAGE